MPARVNAISVVASVSRRSTTGDWQLGHIEREEPSEFEPTVGDQLRLAQLVKAAEKADKEELLEMVKLLGHQVFIHYPCATRYLAKEAARNLAGVNVWSGKESEQFTRLLKGE